MFANLSPTNRLRGFASHQSHIPLIPILLPTTLHYFAFNSTLTESKLPSLGAGVSRKRWQIKS